MSKKYAYSICDVFTSQRFGGNPLAVITDARGLSGPEMQKIAREFNFSETTFVLPAEAGGDRRVRIFTPSREVPFAGHPNIGTAFILNHAGALTEVFSQRPVTFEEQAGMVAITRDHHQGQTRFELTAPEPFSRGVDMNVELVARALGLTPEDIRVDRHPPCIASAGLAFIVVELEDMQALGRLKADLKAFDELAALGIMPDVHAYVRLPGDHIRCRMLAPLDGVPEDPATGSANAAMAGLLASVSPQTDGALTWRVEQGVEMGRPSELSIGAEKRGGEVTRITVAGTAVLFARGELHL